MPLRDILGVLRDAYARTVGVEYMHIQEPDQKEWIQERVEGVPTRSSPLDEKHRDPRAAQRGRGVRALPAHQVPRAEAVQPRGRGDARPDARRAVQRRRRLRDDRRRASAWRTAAGSTCSANVVGKSYSQIFREFEGELDPASTQGSGDVKYHLGAIGKHQSPDGARGQAHARRQPQPPRGGRPGRRRHGARHRRREPNDDSRNTVLPVLAARRRRVRGPGRRRRDVQPLRGARLRGRRHRARRREQPARVHDRARARSFERVRHRRRQDGAGADLPRERRRPRSRGAGDAARVRVPAHRSRRTSSSTSSATAATATTRPTSRRSPSRACTSSSTRTSRCARSTRSSWCNAATSAVDDEQAVEPTSAPGSTPRSRRRTPAGDADADADHLRPPGSDLDGDCRRSTTGRHRGEPPTCSTSSSTGSPHGPRASRPTRKLERQLQSRRARVRP